MARNHQKYRVLNKQSITVIVAIAIAVAGATYTIFSTHSVTTDNAYIKADIVMLSAKVTGYVKEVRVADNQAVKRGDVIAVIDPADFQQRVNQAEASLHAMAAKLEMLLSQEQQQGDKIEEEEAGIRAAQAMLDRANKDLTRVQTLTKRGASPMQSLDNAVAEQENRIAQFQEQRAQRAGAEDYLLVIRAQIRETEAELQNAEASLELAKLDYANATIYAPFDGIIGNKSIQLGQLVRPGAVLAYLVHPHIWVEANFKESQISNMVPGQKAKITVDAISGKSFYGVVDSIAPAAGSEFSLLPAENATGNFTKIVRRVPVKIALDDGQNLQAIRPGLSTEVTVYTRSPAQQANQNP
jgi:membrane fusion protein (multidrug efflux system)